MVIELIGGPLDGALIEGPSNMPLYLVVDSHDEGPVYRIHCCQSCGSSRQTVPYFFLGYEQTITYEYPEKSQIIQALRQEEARVSDTESEA